MRPLNVVCIQMDITFGDPAANYDHAEELIRQAARTGPDVLLLPELWTTGYALSDLATLADTEAQQTTVFIDRLTRELNVNIIAGSIAKQTPAGIANTLLAFERSGSLAGEYSKAHLFQPMEEHRYLVAGSERGLFPIDHIPCAGLICYDIRFPEWVRVHVVAGAVILFVAAEWPLARLHHWRSLLISRAIENQCFVVACNRAGADPNHVYAGHSLVINPWGTVLAEAGEAETLLAATLRMELVAEAREAIPVLTDRRPELYHD
jgi:predicted amidohydrolase